MEAFGQYSTVAAGVDWVTPDLNHEIHSGAAANLPAQILECSWRLDPAGVRLGLDQAAASSGLAGCIDEVLLPVMRQIGLWWAAGRFDVSQERMTTEAVRAWLDGQNSLAPTPLHPDPILLACGPRDQHTIGLESLALLLRFQGWPCRVLGARTSVFDLLTATRATGPAAVVVVSHLESTRIHAVTAINEAHRQGHRVFYAGNAFGGRSAREKVSGDYLGAGLGNACTQLCIELSATN